MSSTFPLLRNQMLYSVPIADSVSCPVVRQINRPMSEPGAESNSCSKASLSIPSSVPELGVVVISGPSYFSLTSLVSPWLATTPCELDCSFSAPQLSSRLLGCMYLVAGADLVLYELTRSRERLKTCLAFAGINQCAASSPRQAVVFL
ncbi:hypothetical protein AG1IA_10113 [Rhizoctonia solani AG-1 IA]|uniref:Uncharacterized protein n=1 Tax=Thanatephorus cucumeris (strain AG1-IA) TaxID=983506 RepID=L8WGL7_THACA|nr:hypothetical protein AG1IA_10113 [Rhizoctonia solani AG-1 IA]